MGKKREKIKEVKEKILWQWKAMEYVSYLIIFLVPLFVNKDLTYSFYTSKLIVFLFLALIQATLYFWGSLKENNFKIKISPLRIILLLFFLVLTISSLFGVDSRNSFWAWKDYVSLVPLYFLSLFSIFIGFLIRKNKKFLFNLLFVSLMTSIVVLLLYYFSNSSDVFYQGGSTLGNNSYLGTYLLFNFFFGLGLLFYSKKIWQKILLFFMTLFIFINPIFINKDFLLGKINILEAIKNPIIIGGVASGAILGLGISVVVFSLLFLISLSRKKILKISGFILFVLIFFGFFYVGQELVDNQSKIHHIYVEEKSDNRFLAWDIAKIGFYKHPIIGSGYNNYIYNFQEQFNPKFYSKDNMNEVFYYPHNVFWQFASDTGILGLISYLSLLVMVFIVLFRAKEGDDKNERMFKIILGTIMFGYFIQNLFIFDTIVVYLMFFLLIGVALGYENIREYEINKKFTFIKKAAYVMGIIFCLSGIVFLVYLPWKEAGRWKKIVFSSNNMLGLSEKIEGLQDISLFGGIEDSTYQAKELYDLYKDNMSAINEKIKPLYLKEIISTIEKVEKDIIKQPNYSDSYLILGRLIDLYMLIEMREDNETKITGKNYNKEMWDKSFNYLNKALELNPNNAQTYLELANLYFVKKDFESSYSYMKKAIILAPENPIVYQTSKNLLKIKLDSNFQKYVDEMERRWTKAP